MMNRVFCTAGLILLLAFPSGPLAGESLDRGIKLFEAGDFTAAKSSLEGVLASDEENHTALFYLGRIALVEEDLDGAIDRFQKAVRLNGTDSVYRNWLGRAYVARLQTVSFFERGVLAGRALENFRKAVELVPSNIEARISLGEYYLDAPSIAGGSTKKAREQAEEVLKHNPVAGNSMLARIHIKNEEYDQAIEKLNSCIEAEPNNLEYRHSLGMLYQKLERYKETFDIFERILEVDHDDRGALYQIGRTAVFSGLNTDRGIECLEMYLTKDVKPGYPGVDSAHWRLGTLFELKGDVTRARTEYETAARLNPDENKYKESLKKLDEN
jgi:tetratricopeptide (TPR) repeat protein